VLDWYRHLFDTVWLSIMRISYLLFLFLMGMGMGMGMGIWVLNGIFVLDTSVWGDFRT
jgi:hypothetical protein